MRAFLTGIRTVMEEIALESDHNSLLRGFLCRFAKLRQVDWLREGVPLPRPRLQVVHGTVPPKCARNALPARSGMPYRPARGELRDRPLPTSSTRAPEATPN